MKKIISTILKSKKYMLITGVILALIVISLIIIISRNKKEEVTNDYVVLKLEKASELTTAKLTYRGFTTYKDDGTKFIDRSDFIMTYTATARAGIDVKDVEVDTNNITKTITLKIPKAKILDVKVDLSSIKYYDEKFALFNFDKKEDANKANKMAEEAAKEELSNMGILEMADEQAEALLKGLISDATTKGYDIIIKRK